MAPDSTFKDFIRRVRAGDAEAAAELLRRYESAIRLEVRMRLRDRRLSRLFDSMDICQSVLASFFMRAAAGQYDLEQPDQLLKLLVVMARNKLANAARKQQAQRRDHRRAGALPEDDLIASETEASPSRIVAGRELLERVRSRLTPEEVRLMELRAEGHEWADVARELGGTPEARRKQFSRALDRVSQELQLDEADHE